MNRYALLVGLCASGVAAARCAPGGAGNGNTALSPEAHEPHFPIATGTHGGIDCNSCHGEFDTFRKFSCTTGCHAQGDTDPKHSGVDGYAWDSGKCLECHPRGEGSSVDHAKYFPIGTGAQHEAVCGNCHRDASNRMAITCADTSCHVAGDVDPKHTGNNMGDYKWDSALCLRCHADAQVDTRASHPSVIRSPSRHRNATCFDCHPDRRADKPWGENFQTRSCLKCHDSNNPD